MNSRRGAQAAIALSAGSCSHDAKRVLRRLRAPALALAPCSEFWYCYNDGRQCIEHPRHAWLHCRFELDGLDGAEATYLRHLLPRAHFLVRFDMTARTVEGGPATIVLQEHWSETDPDTARFTECVHCIDPGRRWTRGEIKACIAEAWAELQTYADAGVEADGRLGPPHATQPCPRGVNNCVTFARHCFHLLCSGSATAQPDAGRVDCAVSALESSADRGADADASSDAACEHPQPSTATGACTIDR